MEIVARMRRSIWSGALVYFPIILNIFVITVSLGFRGTPVVTGLMLPGCLYLLFRDYERLAPLFGRELQSLDAAPPGR